MNKFIGIGRLTKDIELRNANGKEVATFTLAISRKFKNQNGEYETDFFNCVAWKNAKTLSEYAKKGDLIGVECRLQNRNYEVDGQKKYITEIIVDSFEFLSTKKVEKQEETHNDPYSEFSRELTKDELPF